MPSKVGDVNVVGKPKCLENQKDDFDEEMENEGLLVSLKRYPKGVFFMLGNEFCERFSFYGMRAILTLYLIEEHHFSDSTASFFYHAFISLAYFSPLFGSIAADNYLGRFRVILWVSLFYVFGHALLSIGAVPYIHHSIRSSLDIGGLIIIALSTGGIKPCVSAFAADQFEENRYQERAQFFSFFYFSINAGSLVAIMLTPILRGRVQCFGSQYCFPLAFGVPGVLMLFAFFIFLFGWKFYKITPAGKGNVIWKVFKCITTAIKGKVQAKIRRQDTAEHWLDYATPKYSDSLVAGVKSLVAVSILFIPVVFFWALFDQQGSTWVLQARRLDGRVGWFTILPDQMNTFNPLIVLIMVPIFEAFIYPALRRVCKITPLRKMAAGGCLAALAFVLAGLLQLKVNDTLEPLPADGYVFLQRIGNSSANFLTTKEGFELKVDEKSEWPIGNYTIRSDLSTYTLNLDTGKRAYVIGLFDRPNAKGQSLTIFPYTNEKSENGMTIIYILIDEDSDLINSTIYVIDYKGNICNEALIRAGVSINIQPTFISDPNYLISYGNCVKGNETTQLYCDYEKRFFAQMGAAHILNLAEDRRSSAKDVVTTLVVRPNSINMLWQLPQFFVITLGEVLFSVTGLEFSYSQAAPTMKSVLQALWLLTTFFGNVIDMGISGTHVIHEPAMEFFFYAILMLIVIAIFIAISMNYTYVNEHSFEEEDSQSDNSSQPIERDPGAKSRPDLIQRRPLKAGSLAQPISSEKDSQC